MNLFEQLADLAAPETVPETPIATASTAPVVKSAGRIISISPDVRLSQQDGEVTLERRTVVEKGKHAGEERWLFVGSYGCLGTAAGSLITRHYGLLQPEHVTDLKALLVELRKAAALIAKAVAP
jgi:hypothetical protein